MEEKYIIWTFMLNSLFFPLSIAGLLLCACDLTHIIHIAIPHEKAD